MYDLRRLLIGITLVAGFIIVAAEARGQINTTLFPTPITSEELEEYATILSLTTEQSQAIESAFQEYQQACSVIGQNDIPKFNADRKIAQRTNREDAFNVGIQKKFYRRCLAIRTSYEVLDNLFLEQLNSKLTEDQRTQMLHVRLRRERDRYRWTILRTGQVRLESTIDLMRLLRTIELSDDDRKALKLVSEGYEAALTAAVSHYGSALIKRMIVWGDEQTSQEELTLNCNIPGIGVIETNRKWLDTIANALSPQSAVKLRYSYRKEAYHGIVPDLESAHRMFDAVLKKPQLSDDQKSAITSQRDSYINQHTQLTERIIVLLDELRRLPEFWIAVGTSTFVPLKGLKEVLRLMDRRLKLNIQAAKALAEYLGDSGILTLRRAARAQYKGKERVRLPKPNRMQRFMSIKLANSSMRGSPMGGTPVRALFFVQSYPPIKTQWIHQLADELELTDSQRDIAQTLHEQYVTDLKLQSSAIPEKSINGDYKLWTRNEENSFLLPTLNEVEELHSAKMRIIDSFRQTEIRFFEDLGSVIALPKQTAKLAIARRSRLRYLYLHGNGSKLWIKGSYIGGRSKLYEVDLMPLLNGIEPLAENAEQFNTIRNSYDVTTAKLAQKRFQAVHDCKLLADQMLIESFHDGDEYYEFSLIGDNDLARQFIAACNNLASAEEQYYQLNLSTPKQLMELLKKVDAHLLESRFRKAAYPDLIEDAQAMHEKLETVLLKPDLSEHEQNAILKLQLEYTQKYKAFIDKLVATKRHPRDTGQYRIDEGQITSVYSQYGQELQEVNALKFERKELNASIQRRLEMILTNSDK